MIKHEHKDCSAILREIILYTSGGLTTVKVMSSGELDAYHDCHISPGDGPAKMDIRDDDGKTVLRCSECGVAIRCDMPIRNEVFHSLGLLLATVEEYLASAEVTSPPSEA